ncbi:hypothetical protein GGU11DRAFT_758843 [Lentinula aff. detonsa]|nr:hypothetical protein GGU11DRAFT_758843 [Lentinula aff. detonsa]
MSKNSKVFPMIFLDWPIFGAEEAKQGMEAERLVSKGLTVVTGKRRKRIAMVAIPSGDPEGDDPYDNEYIDPSDNDDDNPEPEEPPSSPLKQLRCSQCILKVLKCEMIGPQSASCQGCKKATVRHSLVPDNYPCRSKKTKVKSPVASTSNQTIEDIWGNCYDHAHWSYTLRIALCTDAVNRT